MITQSLFADLHFASIYLWNRMNRRKRSVFNEKHLQKIFFRKLKNYEIMWKKKNGHRNNAMKKIKNRPILRDKIVLMILFIRSHFVIDRACTTIKLQIRQKK